MRKAIAVALVLTFATPAIAESFQPHPQGCPRVRFCGCGVAVRVFGSAVRSLWPSQAWRKFPRSVAGPGKVAIWRSHVAYIEAIDANGNAVVYDPNSGGHRTRVHTRSLAGATIVDPRG